MHTPLCQLGEDDVLSRLLAALPAAEGAPLRQGPGDDCAVLPRDEDWDSLLKVDALVEGVHFAPGTEARLIGRKALARPLSDIAAMGGLPEHALITVLAGSSRAVEELCGIYAGLGALAAEFGVAVAGGETTSLPGDGLALTITLTGRVERGKAILRSGGKPGDVLCVSGRLGGSYPSGRHLSFTPRVELARLLATGALRPSAMMDISDGLAVDLPRLARACGCDYALDRNALPCHPGCTAQQALEDGEDYELLLALPPQAAALLPDFPQAGLTPIGALVPGSAHSMHGGWQHFSPTHS